MKFEPLDDTVFPEPSTASSLVLPSKSVNHLLKAGIIGEKDYLTGVAENIIVGQPISLGTGSVALYYIPEE